MDDPVASTTTKALTSLVSGNMNSMFAEKAKAHVVPIIEKLDPERFVNSAYNSLADVILLLRKDTENSRGVTKALDRASYKKTSFHCPGKELTVEVSLLPNPAEEDWYNLSSGNQFTTIDAPIKWVRVVCPGMTEEEYPVYVHSARYLSE